VLDHARAGRRREETRAGREIEAARAVTASTDGVNGRRAGRDPGLQRKLAHRGRKSADLIGGFALQTQASQERAGHRGRHVALRQLVHQGMCLLFRQRVAVEQRVELGAEFGTHVLSFRKLAINFGPSGVSTLSG
jgi:hypothetical protein